MGISESYALFLCFITFCLCCVTLGQFVLFLSSHSCLQYVYMYNLNSFKCAAEDNDSILAPVLWNLTLVGVFVLQHSLQASEKVKIFLLRKGFGVIERLLYNCGSCISLQIVMYLWQPIPSKTVWEVPTFDRPVLWWIFTTIHFVCWLITYSGCFIMDITELLGTKQVYHYVLDWPQPMQQKSVGLKRFYAHMRHPSFSAIFLILFVHPVMQLDRLILAYACTVYMMARFKVDEIDYTYQRRMLYRKYKDLCLTK